MEPQLTSANTAPNISPEAPAVPTFEQPAQALPRQEAPVQSVESVAGVEQLVSDRAGQPVMPTGVQSPVTVPMVVGPQQQSTIADNDSTPATAADGDVVEKEWIEKVKKVISSTAGDPHAQQKEISRLMAEYVLKRYGRKIGEPKE